MQAMNICFSSGAPMGIGLPPAEGSTAAIYAELVEAVGADADILQRMGDADLLAQRQHPGHDAP